MQSYEKLKYETIQIKVSDIDTEDRFDRFKDNDKQIKALAENIKENGLHTEIWLCLTESKELKLISGARRLEAHKLIDRKVIRAKVFKELSEMDVAYMTCSENSGRLEYDPIEKLENFLFLLHKEFSKMLNKPVEYAPTRYINAITAPVCRLQDKERGREYKLEKALEDKRFEALVKKVFERSGLYPTYSVLYEQLKSSKASSELISFCKEYKLSVRATKLLERTERTHTKATLSMAYNVRAQKINEKQLENISESLEELSWLLENNKALLSDYKLVLTMQKNLKNIVNKYDEESIIKNENLLSTAKQHFQALVALEESPLNFDNAEKIKLSIKNVRVAIGKIKNERIAFISCVLGECKLLKDKSEKHITSIINKCKKIEHKNTSYEARLQEISEDYEYDKDMASKLLISKETSKSDAKKLLKIMSKFSKDIQLIAKQQIKKED